jgi:ankyrin repeat protein
MQGDMGATPLFYAIMQNSVPLVQALISKGAKSNTTIAFEEEVCMSCYMFPFI